MSHPDHPEPIPDRSNSEYAVDWTIQFDAASPIDAAHEALRVLHDTYAGDPDGANVFTVTDPQGRIHSVDLGDLNNPATNTVTAPVGRHGTVPALSREDAYLRLGDEQMRTGAATLPTMLTVRVLVDAETYVLSGGDHELLHTIAFDFGVPYDSSAHIVSVDGSLIGVDYTTDLGDFLRDG